MCPRLNDFWNVLYSSSLAPLKVNGGTRTSIRHNSLLSASPGRSELVVLNHAVPGKRIPRTLLLTVHFSEAGVGIRSYHASYPLLVFAAVKKTAPWLRETICPEVPAECPLFGPVATWDNGPEVPDACILSGVLCVCQCNVSRKRLRSSLLCNIRIAIQKFSPNVL